MPSRIGVMCLRAFVAATRTAHETDFAAGTPAWRIAASASQIHMFLNILRPGAPL